MEKRCSRCKQHKPLADFSSNQSRPDGRNPYCRVCQALYAKSRQQRDIEQYRERVRQANQRRSGWHKEARALLHWLEEHDPVLLDCLRERMARS